MNPDYFQNKIDEMIDRQKDDTQRMIDKCDEMLALLRKTYGCQECDDTNCKGCEK